MMCMAVNIQASPLIGNSCYSQRKRYGCK